MRAVMRVILWAIFANNLARGADDAATPGSILWSFPIPYPFSRTGGVDSQGLIYFTCFGAGPPGRPYLSQVICLSADGKKVWDKEITGWLGHPSITESRVYVWNRDGKLHALDKNDNGREIWAFRTGTTEDLIEESASLCIDFQGNVYCACRDAFLYAISPEGNKLWQYHLKDQVVSSPILDEREGRIYAADAFNTVYAINLQNGTEAWHFDLAQRETGRHEVRAPLALNEFGQLFVASRNWHLYCFDAHQGRVLWDSEDAFQSAFYASPVTTYDGRVIAVDFLGNLRCFQLTELGDRELLWPRPGGESSLGGKVAYSSPVIDGAGNVYFSYSSKFNVSRIAYVNGQTGKILWRSQEYPGNTDGALSLDSTGDLLVAGERFFYKFKGAGFPAHPSGNPGFHAGGSLHGRFELSFPAWEKQHPPADEEVEETPSTDRDQDGLSNFKEYIFGTDPDSSDDPEQPFQAIQLLPDTGKLPYLWFRNAKGIGCPYRIETSPDMLGWKELEIPPWQLKITDQETYWEVQFRPDLTGKYPLPLERAFLRVRWGH